MQDEEPVGRDSENQQLQQELVEEGEKLPGVAEALEAYKRVAVFAGFSAYPPKAQIRNATGGNV